MRCSTSRGSCPLRKWWREWTSSINFIQDTEKCGRRGKKSTWGAWRGKPTNTWYHGSRSLTISSMLRSFHDPSGLSLAAHGAAPQMADQAFCARGHALRVWLLFDVFLDVLRTYFGSVDHSLRIHGYALSGAGSGGFFVGVGDERG